MMIKLAKFALLKCGHYGSIENPIHWINTVRGKCAHLWCAWCDEFKEGG